MPNFTLQDFLKVLIPVIAGGASAYSAPAARAIHGASGSLMAIQENDRRQKELEQEMALRASEGERRGRVLSLQEQEAKNKIATTEREQTGKQGMFDAIGETLARLIPAQVAPNPMNAGPVQPGVEERWQEAQDVGPSAISLIQSIMAKAGPEGAAAALEYLGAAGEAGRTRRETRGKEERATAQRAGEFEKTHALQKKKAAGQEAYRKEESTSQAEYRKEMAAARTEEVAVRKAAAEAKATDTAPMTAANKRIAELTGGLLPDGTPIKAKFMTPAEWAELKILQKKVAALGGLNTPAGHLDYLFGPQAGRP